MSAELRKTFRISRNSISLRCFITACLLLILFACTDLVAGALRNVNLIIEPPAVRRGQHATLRCSYNLDGAPLYSAKFYRGQLEFYRYTPGESPSTKVFPFPGIYVDISMSNASQVLIRNVGFGLSGNFSCEVTADAPLFSTATAFETMLVVELPEKRPLLSTEHNRYEAGDILRANCSTPPSRPRAELKFTINNMMINAGETQYIRTVDNLIASRISLKLQLQGVHFTTAQMNTHGGSTSGQMMNAVGPAGGGPSSGGLVLRCTAQIDDLYQEYKELELGTPQRDPVPARVTLSSGSSMKSFFSSYFSSDAAPVRAQQRLSSQLLACSTLASLLVVVSATNLWAVFHEVTFMGSRNDNNTSISTVSRCNKSNNSNSINICSSNSSQNRFKNNGESNNNRENNSNTSHSHSFRTAPHPNSLPCLR